MFYHSPMLIKVILQNESQLWLFNTGYVITFVVLYVEMKLIIEQRLFIRGANKDNEKSI